MLDTAAGKYVIDVKIYRSEFPEDSEMHTPEHAVIKLMKDGVYISEEVLSKPRYCYDDLPERLRDQIKKESDSWIKKAIPLASHELIRKMFVSSESIE